MSLTDLFDLLYIIRIKSSRDRIPPIPLLCPLLPPLSSLSKDSIHPIIILANVHNTSNIRNIHNTQYSQNPFPQIPSLKSKIASRIRIRILQPLKSPLPPPQRRFSVHKERSKDPIPTSPLLTLIRFPPIITALPTLSPSPSLAPRVEIPFQRV